MVTTVTSTERVKQVKVGLGGTPPGNNGPKRNGSGGNGKGKDDAPQRFSPKPYRVMLWIVVAAIFMMFAALVASYIMLSSGKTWPAVEMPRVFWLSTALIIVSSLTLEVARRSLKRGGGGYRGWLWLTLLLGIGFLASQLLAWRQLVAQGANLASNNHSSFFYLLTGAHALHLIIGILALSYLQLGKKFRQVGAAVEMKRQAATGAVSLYWHFLDGLWVFLFLLLFLWK